MQPRDVTHFETPEDFRAWLDDNHESAEELWVGYWKKATKRPSVTWEETVDEALCYGWIDGIRQRLDDEAYAIRFTPRRSTSVWSLRNIERFRILSDAGRMKDAGRAAWSHRREDQSGVYSFEQPSVPGLSAAFLEELEANSEAGAFWHASPPGYRRQAAHWVMSAKKPETRERRLAVLIQDSAEGLRVKPLRRRPR